MPGLFPMRLPQNSGFLRKGRWRAFRMTLIEVQQPFRAYLAWRPSRGIDDESPQAFQIPAVATPDASASVARLRTRIN